MGGSVQGPMVAHLSRFAAAADRIEELQQPDGAIPWFKNGPWDSWNHVESAMALVAMERMDAANAAYDHLEATQRPDGAWAGEYGNALPMADEEHMSRERAPTVLDTNFTAYPAVGLTHYLLKTDDLGLIRRRWPMIRAAMDFILSLQREDGAFHWSADAVGTDMDDALLTGNASTAKSLECAIYLAGRLGEASDDLEMAHAALANALRTKPDAFDRRGNGARFAMDWYYPVLSGVLDKTSAQHRLKEKWATFITPHMGCRCVSDEPWITVAETCELVMALLAVGDRQTAQQVLASVSDITDDNGVFWMGWQYEEDTVWPSEKPSWTQAAMILAVDAMHGSQPSSRLLIASVQ